MHILAVDDEQIMLKELTTELVQVFPDAQIQGFQEPQDAEHWASELAREGKTLAYAFMDIRMRGMSGIELAKRLKLLHPGTVLIFCTAYTEYAFDYEKGIVSAINSFRGEYMVNYSWAEFKTGTFVAMEQNRS